MNSFKEAYSALADKPILTSSDWFKQPYQDKDKVPADLYCDHCKQVKTFVGNAHAFQDATISIATGMAQQIDRMSGLSKNIIDQIKVILDEVRLSYDNIEIIKLTCPVCNNRIYLVYAIESESRTVGENSKAVRTNFYKAIKIGEYPSQDTSRLLVLAKYQTRFPAEYDLLVKALKAYQLGLGAGAIVYIRKAYETLLNAVLDSASIDRSTVTFRDKLQKANDASHIVPTELEGKAYGLFRELSDNVHGDGEDTDGIAKYENLRIVFLLILDSIMQKERNAEIIAALPDDNRNRGTSNA
jgi:hypothetical protein